ncbi:MAG TPA: 2-oxo-tetronate isomerase [Gammaproteobacteria bacterium]|nr:2-oxo-tetronate isomerase [Gammaproteobacteria bacterium]
MPRFAANLTMLFNEVDFLDRFEAAAKAGFKGVEYLFPYDYPAAELKARLDGFGLVQVVHNVPCGDWAAGERGIACLPERVEEFRAGVERAIDYATVLGCTQVNCLAGIAPAGVDEDRVHDTFVENLAFAAGKLKGAGIRLLIEPVNTRDIPGFYLCHTDQAFEIISQTGSDNIALQYDIYHMQIMQGDLARTLEEKVGRIEHIQLADNPGRHEPGTGEINYPFLFDHIDRIGYRGWIGCEYKPAKTTVEGLGWAAAYLEPGR